MPLFPDYLQMRYQPDAHVLYITWTSPVTMSQLQAGYEQIRLQAEKFMVSRWLIDARQRPLTSEQRVWVYYTFLPGLYTSFAEPVRVASLQTPDQLLDIRNDPALLSTGHLTSFDDAMPFRLQLFDHPEAALAWLTRQALV